MAARNGIVCAQLARHGLQAAPTAIEGRNGFAQAFTGSTEHTAAIVEDLGQHWELLEVTQKPYPVGGNSQPRIEAMLDLVHEHGVSYNQIEHIVDTINSHEGAYPGVDHKGPFGTIGAALMNPRFCVATAAVHGDVKIAHLQRVDDPRVLELVQRIDLRFDDTIPEFSSRLEVTLKDGRTLHAERVDAASSYKFSLERALALARSLQDEMPIEGTHLGALADFVGSIERQDTVDELIALCTAPRAIPSLGVPA
jgi:2-methylcitrate dehydratase PrpD